MKGFILGMSMIASRIFYKFLLDSAQLFNDMLVILRKH